MRKRWTPATKAQHTALNSAADILLYGGAAGGGKSEFILVDAAVEFRNPNLRAILFRESFPNLRDLILKSYKLYRRYPYFGDYNKTDRVWKFPTNARELADPANIERVVAGKHGRQYTDDGQPAITPIYVDGMCGTVEFRYLDSDDQCEIQHQGQEYSFIGVDESTHQTEYRIRYLLTRLRSTDPTLRLRMRLTTNPGGESHVAHMKIFISWEGVCPHCHPNSDKARKPFAVYKDACWSDGTPLSQVIDGREIVFTTQFVPARLSDHNLFGDGNVRYKAQLRSQRPSTAKALEEGCWAQFEGQYFTVWEENRGVLYDEHGRMTVPQPDMRMVIPVEDLPELPWWYPQFTGCDYGFTISHAGAVLCVRTPAQKPWFPNGRIYAIDEYLEPGVLAEDVATDLLERWFLERQGGAWVVPERSRNIQAWFLSPDADNETGVKSGQGVSITRMTQMNQKLNAYGMGFTKAANEREGGWQHIFRLLRSGELVISARCKNLIQAIPSRIRDPKRPDDILKVHGDPLDDLIDAFRYALYSWFKVSPSDKPVEVELAERLQGVSDPTNAMLTRGKLRDEVAQRNGPIFIGGKARQRQQMMKQNRFSKKPF